MINPFSQSKITIDCKPQKYKINLTLSHLGKINCVILNFKNIYFKMTLELVTNFLKYDCILRKHMIPREISEYDSV